MNNKKILLVDDEASLRETISELLIHSNYSVMTAENGKEALEILDSWTPNIIISDIMMPVMDGYLFYEKVKDSSMLNHIPFIFFTAKNDKKEKEKCMLNGVNLFISKPFKIENLIAIIEIKLKDLKKKQYNANTFLSI
jgi:two-component system sensor histidine kinase/response regulator